MEKKKNPKRVIEGIVVSDKMDKTIVITVTRRFFHSLYKKIISKRKKYKVHDEKNTAKVGDKVRAIEAKPFSKEKRFKLLEIVK